MSCKRCGTSNVSGLCGRCAFEKSREGHMEAEVGNYDAVTDGGPSLPARLENAASTHANDALAAMDERDTERAEYHARQLLQVMMGLNQLPDTEEVTA